MSIGKPIQWMSLAFFGIVAVIGGRLIHTEAVDQNAKESVYGVGSKQLHFLETVKANGEFQVTITPNPYAGSENEKNSEQEPFFAYEAYIAIKCKTGSSKKAYDLTSDTGYANKKSQTFSFKCLDQPIVYNGSTLFVIADDRPRVCAEAIMRDNSAAQAMCSSYQ